MVLYIIFLSASQHFKSIMEIQAFHFSVNTIKNSEKRKRDYCLSWPEILKNNNFILLYYYTIRFIIVLCIAF